jgi:hypothetical protein
MQSMAHRTAARRNLTRTFTMTNRLRALQISSMTGRWVAVAAALVLAGASVAQAQPMPASGPGAHAGHPGMGAMAGPGAPAGARQGRMGPLEPAQVQQRLAQAKQSLKITADQEGAWATFAGFMTRQAEAHRLRLADRETEMLNRRLKEVQARKEGKTAVGPTAPEQLAQGVDHAKQHLADLEAMSGAVKTLYAVLTPEQRLLADRHMAQMRHARRGAMGHHPMGHGGPDAAGHRGPMHGMGPGAMGAGPAQ